jgi:hypothetical protein
VHVSFGPQESESGLCCCSDDSCSHVMHVCQYSHTLLIVCYSLCAAHSVKTTNIPLIRSHRFPVGRRWYSIPLACERSVRLMLVVWCAVRLVLLKL